MADMRHHLRAVRRGVTDAYLLVDMPYAADRDVEARCCQRETLFI